MPAESNNHHAADTKVEQLARMYAKAFVDAASNAHQLDALAEEFEALVDEILDQHPQFEALVNSSRIKKEEKQQILDRVFGGRTSDMVLQFLKVLAIHERLDCLRPIAQEVHLLHRERRGPEWDLAEAPIDLPAAIRDNDSAENVLLIDCLSVWATNLLIHEHDTAAARQALIAAIEDCEARIILVASETGLGIVPDNSLSRRFRDINGLQNQAVAAVADEVFFMTAGLALRIKPPQ